jgi:uncharacterized protein (DUF1800 family)
MRTRVLVAVVLLVALGAVPSAHAADDDARILHALNRVTYGPRPGDVERVRAIGLAAYLEQQLAPSTIDDRATEAALASLGTLRMSIPELLLAYPRPDPRVREKVQTGEMSRRDVMEMYPPEKRPARIVAELQAAKAVRAVMSERQLQEVMTDFWFNHFNVYATKGEGRWYVGPYERDVIRPLALGRFPDLLRATAHHPAMLFYLDNWLSARPDFVVMSGPQRGRRGGLNENYGRELMELHTLGVDGGYTQQDVREVARAFTGWSIDKPQIEGRFIFRPRVHDPGVKTVLGRRISGSGQQEGEHILDLLAHHPATARFISTKLVRRFVADDPPPALVERVAVAYRQTGGDVVAMLRVIFAAPEFYADDARRAKIKRPFEFVVSAVRSIGGAIDAQGGVAVARAAATIGEPLYECEPPTGYADRAEAWVNPGALLARMNFGLALAHQRVSGVRVDLAPLAAGADRSRPAAVLDQLLAAVLHGTVTPETRAVLTSQLDTPEITRLTTDDRGPANTDAEKLLALVLGSPEFQRR